MFDSLLSKTNDLSKVKEVLRQCIGELESVKSRDAFVRDQYADFANVLLRRVTLDWYACFDKKDRVELFERIFVDISIAPLPESILAIAAGLKRQISTKENETDRVSERKRLDVIGTILRKAIRSTNIQALVRCLYKRVREWSDIEYKAMEGALMQVVVSLPERTRNAVGTETFGEQHSAIISNVRTYFSRTCVSLVSELSEDNNKSIDVAARWISKLCVVGQSEIVSSCWLETFLSEKDLRRRKLHRVLLQKIRGAPLEYLIREMIVKISTKSKYNRKIITNELFDFVLSEKSSASRHIVSNRLLRGGGRWCVSCKLIRQAVDMLASACDNACFDMCFKSCMESWANVSFAKNGGYLAQRHIVVAIVRYFHHNKQINRSPHVSCILKGVQHRLDSSRHQIRDLSMIVATRFSHSLNPQKTLNFDDCDFNVKKMASILEEEEDDEKIIEMEEDEKITENEIENAELKDRKNRDNKQEEEEEEEEEEDMDPDKPILTKETNDEKNFTALLEAELERQIVEEDEDVEYDSDDSEASMEEYDVSEYHSDLQEGIDDEIDSNPVCVPTFLRDCIDVLHKNENARLMSETLRSIPSLIEGSRLDDVQTMATALLSAILHLDDKYALPDFSKSCYDAAVKITVTSPLKCVRVLMDESFGSERSVGDRIASLNIMEGAARVLSSFSRDSEQDDEKKALSKTNQQRDVAPVGKSRRWGSGRREKIPSQANRFAPLAGTFFFPLSSKFGRPFRTPRGISSNVSMLTSGFEAFLIRYVETLGLLIRCARLSSSTPKMCSTMIRIALVLRYHKNADVRLAVLHSIFCIIEACDVNKSVFDVIEQDVMDLMVWIDLCAAGDSNIKCREKSEAIREILRNCKSRLSSYCVTRDETLFEKIKLFSSSHRKINTTLI